ncbi:TolC family protein, partial [Helicobacter sp. MIT 14-3879]|uniref:TolC family protein n=1 Tax=Helicobacter sp. MIT 14-3879 TaxID=2040649 RepID=UPI000E36E866
LENSHIAISEISFENLQESKDYLWNNADIKTLLSNLNDIESEKFLYEIMQSNYEIAIAHLQYAISTDSIQSAKRSLVPDLGFNFSYMFRLNKPDMFALGISMPLPIWGKEPAQVKEAQYQNLLQQSQVLEISNKIKHNAKTLLSKLKTLQENLVVIDSTLIPA